MVVGPSYKANLHGWQQTAGSAQANGLLHLGA